MTAAAGKVDRAKRHTVDEALRRSRRVSRTFDESGTSRPSRVNPKHADQMVRGAIVLPARHRQDRARPRVRRGDKGGKRSRQAPTWPGRRARRPLSEGFMDFDRVIATPD